MSEKVIRVKTFLVSTGLLVLILSCASGPTAMRSAPDWVYTPPEDTAEVVYFVSSGSNTSGNLAAAEEKARNALVEEVIRTMGVKITAATTEEAREAFENFKTEIQKIVVKESADRMEPFRVAEKWIDQRESQVVLVYLLGEYNKNLLMEEQERIRALFEEQGDDVSVREKQGDLFLDRGENYTAALNYLDAAVLVLAADTENRNISFMRNMEKARTAVNLIRLEKLNDNLDTVLGEPFPDGFRLSVSEAGSARIGVSYMGNNDLETIEADSTGLAVFVPETPGSAGSGSIEMYLDFRSALEALAKVPDELEEEVNNFENQAALKSVTFSYRVYSRAKDVPTGIMILDVDRAGNPRQSRDTAAGIVESLTRAEFTIVPVPDRFLHNRMEDGEIIAKAKLMYGNRMDRLIFGVIEIVDFGEDEGNYLIEVEGTVTVADLVSGRVVLRESSSKRSRGSNTVSVISAAFKSLGLELGQKLVSKLQ